MGTLLSVNVGLPNDVWWQGRTVRTGIFKSPVHGPVMVRRLNVDGDGQGDLRGHGGENRAVLVYQSEAYGHWRSHLQRDDLDPGAFGENFTVSGMADDEVCIGDRFRVGEAEFEVTQPRVTCFRVGMRLGVPDLPQLLVAHRRPGFYLRVITEGYVRAGDAIIRTHQGRHMLSVAEIDALLYLPDRDPARVQLALDVPALSPGWAQSFRELLARPPMSTNRPAWQGFRPLRVTDVHLESPTVISIGLSYEHPLPPTAAGEYLVIRVDGAADPPPLRSYSLSGGGANGTYRISVKREPRGLVSGWLHDHLRIGAEVQAAAPRGDFHLTDDERPLILLSAGIGVTPLLAMLHHLVACRSTRHVVWIHTTRDRSSHAFVDEVSRLIDELPGAEQHVFYTGETPPRRLEQRSLAALDLPSDADVYICGPAAFMDTMRDGLIATGIDPSDVHTETFGTMPAINPGTTPSGVRPHLPPGALAAGPRVTFSRVGLTVRWSPNHGTLLELAEACDVPTRYSCRSGVCHVCTTGLITGTAAYPRQPLEDPADGSTLICCAAPLTDIVLDL